MMKYSVAGFNRAKTRMADDFSAAMASSAELLKAAADVSGEGVAVAQAKVEEKLGSARASLAGASQAVGDKARQAAAAADNYAHASPWTAIGLAAAAGVLIGFLAARR